MRVAVLRGRNLPKFIGPDVPHVDHLLADDRRLIEAFASRGVEAQSVVWRDPQDWDRFDLALIRSTWDYIDEPERFLAVLSEIAASSCRLRNPLEAVRWNSEKTYLFDLCEWGIPTVPTYRAPASDRQALQRTAIGEAWGGAVLKPTVGGGGFRVSRVAPGELAGTLEGLSAEEPGLEFLVQPLVESVVTEGEWSFIFVDGTLSHVLLKRPAPGDYRAQEPYGGVIEAARPPAADASAVQRMLERLPFDLLYARLDLVRVGDHLSVMEVELIEPVLYFNLAPEAAGRLAEAAMAGMDGPR